MIGVDDIHQVPGASVPHSAPQQAKSASPAVASVLIVAFLQPKRTTSADPRSGREGVGCDYEDITTEIRHTK